MTKRKPNAERTLTLPQDPDAQAGYLPEFSALLIMALVPPLCAIFAGIAALAAMHDDKVLVGGAVLLVALSVAMTFLMPRPTSLGNGMMVVARAFFHAAMIMTVAVLLIGPMRRRNRLLTGFVAQRDRLEAGSQDFQRAQAQALQEQQTVANAIAIISTHLKKLSAQDLSPTIGDD
jgi:hypothetical protein